MKNLAVQQYPLKNPLPKIERHDQLPPDAKEIARCVDNIDGPGYEQLYCFVKRKGYLSILVSFTVHLKMGPKYACHQFDFPEKVLPWFPNTLQEFRKPPIVGGPPPGTMITPDQDVDGEMLAVGATTGGYDLTNWSRNSHTARPGWYEPMRLSLKWEFLDGLGFLALWRQLGEYYERGLYQ